MKHYFVILTKRQFLSILGNREESRRISLEEGVNLCCIPNEDGPEYFYLEAFAPTHREAVDKVNKVLDSPVSNRSGTSRA